MAEPSKSASRGKLDWVLMVFIIISFISILIPIGIYRANWGGSQFSKRPEDWILFSNFFGGTLGPIVSALSLLISGYIVYAFNGIQRSYQQKHDAEALQQTTIDLFKEFRSEQMSKARSKAWEMKRAWDKEAGEKDRTKWVFRKALVLAMIKEMPVDKDGIKIKAAHLRAVNDVIAFYTMLSLYQTNEQNISALNYFYYPWWRSFLNGLTAETDRLYHDCLSDIHCFENWPGKAQFIKNMQYGPPLRALDEMLSLQYDPEVDVVNSFGLIEFEKLKPHRNPRHRDS